MRFAHRAVLAGCAVALSLAAAPSAVFAAAVEPAAQEHAEALPAPAAYDKADFYQDAPADEGGISLLASSLSPVYLSDEMKYFTKYESHSNYDQGFSYGDGYNAMGYYQFDRRYSLVGFITDVYNYDPAKYSMFASVIARGDELFDGSVSLYDEETQQLTEVGKLAQDAWHAAYATDPAEFSALQDAWAYNNYYVLSERWLASEAGGGIVLTGRADCVKGLVWSMTNLFGAGGVRDFFAYAELDNSMTDREMVNALVDAIVENIEAEYPNQTQYHNGWINRYERERQDCLAYIAEDEAQGGSTQPNEPSIPTADPGVLRQFVDFDAGAWYATQPEDLLYTVEHGFMSGYSDGSGAFGFDDTITRGQVAVVLWRLAGEPEADARNFADVDYSDYYGDAIEWARYTGVINGYSDAYGSLNRFGPDEDVTRQDLAIMLANYAAKIGHKNTSSNLQGAMALTDWSEVGSWAQSAVGWAYDQGIMTGSIVNGTALFQPTSTATRAQAGVMIARLYRDVLS